nr:GNAT family N-acetyltransferase [Curtobacterium sp. DN_7.5]
MLRPTRVGRTVPAWSASRAGVPAAETTAPVDCIRPTVHGRRTTPDRGRRRREPSARVRTRRNPMLIRDCTPADLPALTDLTIEVFRPLFTESLPTARPAVTAHDHGRWEDDYRAEVPALLAPAEDRFITLAEGDGLLLGYVGWTVTGGTSGRLEMVAVHPGARRRGVGRALCTSVVDRLRARGVRVVHIGTGGDAFHASARALYESLGFVGYPTVDYARAL